MKLYEAKYEVQEGLDPKAALEKDCRHTRTDGRLEIFTKHWDWLGSKAYALDSETDEITEVCAAHPLYTLNSVVLSIYAGYLLLTGFEGNLFPPFISSLIPISAIAICSWPYAIANQHPDGFRTANYPKRIVPDLKPVVFRNHVTFAKITYLNYIITGIILHSEIFNELNVLFFIYLLGPLAMFLMSTDSHDPATKMTLFLSIFALLPFAIPVINVLIYSQWEQMVISISDSLILNILLINNFLTFLKQIPVLGLLFTNAVVVYGLIVLKRELDSPGDPFDIYNTPATINDKKYTRVAVSVILLVYLVASLVLFISHLVGYPVVPAGTLSWVLIYWPLLVIILAWVAIWYQQRYLNTIDVDTNNSAFEINGIPVVFTDTTIKTAFPTSGTSEPVIILSEKLREGLSETEIVAVCYHELYHIMHNSIRYQSRIQLPIIGYLLFFLSTNLSDLYNEEYYADEFAAQEVGAEIVLDTLRKAQSIQSHQHGSIIQNEIDKGWSGFIRLLCLPPILSLYSPTIEHRIKRLEKIKAGDA